VFRFGLLDTARACRTNTMGIGAEEMDEVLARRESSAFGLLRGNEMLRGYFEGLLTAKCGAGRGLGTRAG